MEGKFKYVLVTSILSGCLVVMILPQRITCGNCGGLLYTGIELESPTEIIQRYNGICPKCRKKLNFDIETIKIIPVAEK